MAQVSAVFFISVFVRLVKVWSTFGKSWNRLVLNRLVLSEKSINKEGVKKSLLVDFYYWRYGFLPDSHLIVKAYQREFVELLP